MLVNLFLYSVQKYSCEFILNNVKKPCGLRLQGLFFLLEGPYMQLAVINIFILRYSLTGGHHNAGGRGEKGGIFSWHREKHELSLR